MHGIFVNNRRPKTKKEVKEAVKNDPDSVRAEATSIFGNEFDGRVTDMPPGTTIYFVGPDPYEKRSFYGQVYKNGDGSLNAR